MARAKAQGDAAGAGPFLHPFFRRQQDEAGAGRAHPASKTRGACRQQDIHLRPALEQLQFHRGPQAAAVLAGTRRVGTRLTAHHAEGHRPLDGLHRGEAERLEGGRGVGHSVAVDRRARSAAEFQTHPVPGAVRALPMQLHEDGARVRRVRQVRDTVGERRQDRVRQRLRADRPRHAHRQAGRRVPPGGLDLDRIRPATQDTRGPHLCCQDLPECRPDRGPRQGGCEGRLRRALSGPHRDHRPVSLGPDTDREGRDAPLDRPSLQLVQNASQAPPAARTQGVPNQGEVLESVTIHELLHHHLSREQRMDLGPDVSQALCRLLGIRRQEIQEFPLDASGLTHPGPGKDQSLPPQTLDGGQGGPAQRGMRRRHRDEADRTAVPDHRDRQDKLFEPCGPTAWVVRPVQRLRLEGPTRRRLLADQDGQGLGGDLEEQRVALPPADDQASRRAVESRGAGAVPRDCRRRGPLAKRRIHRPGGLFQLRPDLQQKARPHLTRHRLFLGSE